MMKIVLLPLLLTVVLSKHLCAQENKDLIYLQKHTHLNITQDRYGIYLSEDHIIKKKFHDNFEKYADETIYFSDLDLVTSYSAITKVPFKNKHKVVKVTHVETGDILQPGIFYGGYKKMEFIYPKLESGAIGELTYSKNIKDPHFIPPFHFQERHVVKNAVYSVSYPKSMKIKYQLYGNNIDHIQLIEKEGEHDITYQWTYNNVPPYRFEKNAPSRAYTAPHIVVMIESYEVKSQTINVSSNVADLYSWYNGLIENMTPCDKENLVVEMKNIIPTTMNRTDSIETIYRWVQDNIKYVAFEDGMAGFIPRNACDVINKRYGDCKDMANLLKELYQSIGVKAYHTWIGTRKKPYSYKTLPSTIADNHMICAIDLNDEITYLDATNSFSDFGVPSSMIQGKEALIGIDQDHFEVKEVPVIEAENNSRTDSIACTVKDNNLLGNYSGALTGYLKEDFQYNTLKSKIQKNQEFLMEQVAIGENSIQITNQKTAGLDKQNGSGTINFEFNMPNYCRSIGDKYYINLNLHKNIVGEKINIEKRQAPIEENFKYTLNSNTTFTIPAGYALEHIPNNRKEVWTHGYIESIYSITDDVITYKKTYHSNYLLLAKSQFSEWNQFQEIVSDIGQDTIILIKITNSK